MEMTTLGKTGMTVSRYCLGAMMFGAMGNKDHDDCVRIIHKALDAGVNFIDTADVYSAGESEEIVAKALEGRRDNIVLATKFYAPMGKDPNMTGGSRRWIMREVESSLKRLKTDYIDLYQIHRFDERTDLEETMSALSDLVHQGKIRAFGSSMFPADRIVESHWVAEKRGLLRFRCEQPWYSIFSRDIEQYVLPACQRYGMGVITWSPLDGGWLTGRYRKPDDFKTAGRITRMAARRGGSFDPEAELVQRKLALVEELSGIATEAGMPLTHMAIAFTLEHPGVTSTIIGPRTHEQLDDLLSCADVRLSGEVMDRIDKLVPPGTSVNGINMTARPAGISKQSRRRGTA
ncbi:MAG: aldo/keto reductase [Myxococcales bacterium]|nr:aldo/keto reductase [Myxococcales bacterium]MDD9972282.1 aldo/keto reductase [Myxococcales bacterium]